MCLASSQVPPRKPLAEFSRPLCKGRKNCEPLDKVLSHTNVSPQGI